MADTFDIKDTEENSIKKNNNTLKIVGLIILVFATQLSAMFIYERYIQKSIVQKMVDKLRALRSLYVKYKDKNILPDQFPNNKHLQLFEEIDILCDPEEAYYEMIRAMEKKRDSCWTEESKNKERIEIQRAKDNKENIMQFFREVIAIVNS